MKERNNRIFPLIWLVIGTLTVLLCISAHLCGEKITVCHYKIQTNNKQALRIVQLTDLHSHLFGENNSVLAALVEEQKPDLIVMTGDMLDKQDEDADVVCDLIANLAEVAPVYYGYGNHEYTWMETHGKSLTKELEHAGATVLDVDYTDMDIRGQKLRIGGYHGYYRIPGMLTGSKARQDEEIAFADQFEDTDRFKILLCHIPTAWLGWGYIDKHPVDLVLAGHYHGGQIRLPFVGGLYAPYVGLFPEYTEGMFEGKTATVILSTGLGASPGIPRINNLPQISVVDLLPE